MGRSDVLTAMVRPPPRNLMTALKVVVCIALVQLGAAAVQAAARPGQEAPYRFVGHPIAVFTHDRHAIPFFVYVRLNRSVPQNRNHTKAAAIQIDGVGPGPAPASDRSHGWGILTGSPTRHCYEQPLDTSLDRHLPPALARPRQGRRVTIELFVRGAAPLKTEVRLTSGVPANERRYLRELGCFR